MVKKIGIPVLFLVMVFSSCKVGRFVWYNVSGITDYKIFPSRPVSNEEAAKTILPQSALATTSDLKISILDTAGKATALSEFMEENKTVAFLILRNDSIIYERYFNGYEAGADVNCFSVSKSVVSALIGIAIGEGKIKSEDDPVSLYISELKGKYNWDQVTVKHLLHMSSGVKSSENYYSPFGNAATMYYGRTLRKMLLNVKTDESPMTEFEYMSINTQLLGLIIERATGQYLSAYLQEKLWKPMGMEYPATWSIDKENNGIEKAFCCLNAKARDFAKLGLLYLHQGKWNGQQLVPAEWVKKCTVANEEPGTAWFYNRQWWIPSKTSGDFAAVGHLGQYIYVSPRKNAVVLRLGTTRNDQNWPEVLRQITEQL